LDHPGNKRIYGQAIGVLSRNKPSVTTEKQN
jgi:hypothetical protein